MNASLSNGTGREWANLPFYILYAVEGSIIAAANLVIVAAIARFEALRNNKEYTIILGLSLADCINMCGFCGAGLYRIYLLLTDTHNTFKTAWSCLTAVHNPFSVLGLKLSGMMLTVVSIDRLAAVMIPLTYVGWTATYARRLVSGVYIFNFANFLYIYVSAYGKTVYVRATCVTSASVGASTPYMYLAYYRLSMTLYPVLSVVLYGFVMLILHKHFNKFDLTDHPNQQFELKRQRKITMTLLLSAVCTLFLFVLPFAMGSILFTMGHFSIAIIFMCMSNLNPLMNVCIYPVRHREIRQAIKALFTRTDMPHDLKLWNPQLIPQRAPDLEMKKKGMLFVPRGATTGGEDAPKLFSRVVPRSAMFDAEMPGPSSLN